MSTEANVFTVPKDGYVEVDFNVGSMTLYFRATVEELTKNDATIRAQVFLSADRFEVPLS